MGDATQTEVLEHACVFNARIVVISQPNLSRQLAISVFVVLVLHLLLCWLDSTERPVPLWRRVYNR